MATWSGCSGSKIVGGIWRERFLVERGKYTSVREAMQRGMCGARLSLDDAVEKALRTFFRAQGRMLDS